MKRAVLVLLMAGDIHAKERPYSQSSVLIPALGRLDGTGGENVPMGRG